MNILIYIPSVEQSWGGIRQYVIGLLKVLAQDTSNKYFVYHNSSDPEVVAAIRTGEQFIQVNDADVAINWLQRKAVRGKQMSNYVVRRFGIKHEFGVSSTLDRILDKHSIDIIHCPYQFIPNAHKVKTIVTLHDVQELHFPDFFTAEERAFRAVHYLDYLKRADTTVVSYEHIKIDIIKYFAVPDEKINVILLDMDKLWFERFSDGDVVPCGKTGAPEKFILYPANTWKHKNHIKLLHTVALLRDEYSCKVNLVCTGHQNNYYDQVLIHEIENLNLGNQVTFLGVVDERILFSLYHHCVGVVVPTIYEAGSFPLVESIILKVPVICSNVTSLPETVGDEKFVFDPLRIDDMALKIKQLWESDDFRQMSVQNSVEVGQKLRNTGAFEKFVTLYQNLMN